MDTQTFQLTSQSDGQTMTDRAHEAQKSLAGHAQKSLAELNKVCANRAHGLYFYV